MQFTVLNWVNLLIFRLNITSKMNQWNTLLKLISGKSELEYSQLKLRRGYIKIHGPRPPGPHNFLHRMNTSNLKIRPASISLIAFLS